MASSNIDTMIHCVTRRKVESFDLVVASSVTLPEQLDKAAAIPNEPKHQQREAAQEFSRQVLDVLPFSS